MAVIALGIALVVMGSPGLVTAQAFLAEADDYVVDMSFPMPAGSGVHYTDTYDACRSGCSRTHPATDMMADKMVTLHATVDGTICYAPGIDEPMPGVGCSR